jgi:dTMP kinase
MPFIVFEGLDGSGKSSLMAALEQHLLSKDLKVHRTREPGGTPLGDELRELILRKEGAAPSPRAELLLYEAIRAQHVDHVIRPYLQKDFWVLCDRYKASSIAFQAGGRQIPTEWVDKLNEFATQGLDADLTVLLDLPVEESRRRRQNRSQHSGVSEDRIESEADSFHERVRQAFLSQAKLNPQKWVILDASYSVEELFKQLMVVLRGSRWIG